MFTKCNKVVSPQLLVNCEVFRGNKMAATLIKLITLMTMLSLVAAQSCDRDSDCNDDDCCIEYLPYVKRCKDKGDDEGDRCGGQFFCGCKKGLSCYKDAPSFWNYFKLGEGDCIGEQSKTRYDGRIEIVNLPQNLNA